VIRLLVWVAGVSGFVYEITARRMWPQVTGAILGAGLVVWVIGGAALLGLKPGEGLLRSPRRAPVPPMPPAPGGWPTVVPGRSTTLPAQPPPMPSPAPIPPPVAPKAAGK